jgi:hypothetical protein
MAIYGSGIFSSKTAIKRVLEIIKNCAVKFEAKTPKGLSA